MRTDNGRDQKEKKKRARNKGGQIGHFHDSDKLLLRVSFCPARLGEKR